MRRVREIIVSSWHDVLDLQMTLSIISCLFMLNIVALAENGVRFQTASSYGAYCKFIEGFVSFVLMMLCSQ